MNIKNISVVTLCLIFMASLCSTSFARGNRGRGLGRNQGSGGGATTAMAEYNKDTVATLQGVVQKSEIKYNRHMKEDGLHLMLKTSDANVLVHVAPEWYSKLKDIGFADGEKISVLGSVFTKKGEKNIYAATITHANGVMLALRDSETGKNFFMGRKQEELKDANQIQTQTAMKAKHGKSMSKQMKAYKIETVETIKGTVASSKMKFNRHMQENGLHLVLKTAKGNLIVHVAPEWYTELRKISFADGEKVSVTGSVFTKRGEKNIYAANIVHGDGSILALRNPETGKNLFVGRKKGKYEAENKAKRQAEMKAKYGKGK